MPDSAQLSEGNRAFAVPRVVRMTRPRQPHSNLPVARPQSLPPRLGDGRIGLQIRNAARDGIQSSLKRIRQTDQRVMNVEHRRRIAGNDLLDARNILQKPNQFRLTRQNRSSPTARDERRIPDELNRIPQALLGIQKNGPPAQLASIPSRLRTNPGLRRERPDLTAIFVLPPALFEFTLGE